MRELVKEHQVGNANIKVYVKKVGSSWVSHSNMIIDYEDDTDHINYIYPNKNYYFLKDEAIKAAYNAALKLLLKDVEESMSFKTV